MEECDDRRGGKRTMSRKLTMSDKKKAAAHFQNWKKWVLSHVPKSVQKERDCNDIDVLLEWFFTYT
jgi:hypothetical protein